MQVVYQELDRQSVVIQKQNHAAPILRNNQKYQLCQILGRRKTTVRGLEQLSVILNYADFSEN